MGATLTSRAAALALAALCGAAAAVVLVRTSPPPAADVSRGSEDAFVEGLHVREIPPRGAPQRWTRERTVVSFRYLPAGPARVDVRLRGQRGPVMVAADGVVLGSLEAGSRGSAFDLPGGPRPLRGIELRSSVFTAGDGRQLGALLERVSVQSGPDRWPPAGLMLLLALPAVAASAMAMAAGMTPWLALAVGAAIALIQGVILRPNGVVHSPYTATLAILLTGGALLCGAAGAAWNRRRPGAGPAAFVALLGAVLVQAVIGTSPLMVVSDAVFHANNLARVSGGDLFLTSVTQHAQPFRFPYGVSFYVLLTPLLRAGADPVALVRWGAALAGVAAAAGLFGLLVARGPALAALAVLILQCMPGTIEVLSFGNLSNAFAQGVTLLFLAWWSGRARGSWVAGAGLLAVAAIAHLSGFIVLAVLAPWLVWSRWPAIKADRTRALAVGIGLGLAAAYYVSFAGLIASQLARLGEGAGSGGPGIAAALWRQAASMAGQWGLPVVLLALLGRPRPADGGLDRDLTAWWGAGLVMLAFSLATPMDVRWVYALDGAAAIAAAGSLAWLWARGRAARAVGLVLLAVQAGLGVAAWSVALWERYR